jgi:Arc/MetJ-type ribon-helix-helix transcriptional regulator
MGQADSSAGSSAGRTFLGLAAFSWSAGLTGTEAVLTLKTMEVQLTQDQKGFVRQAIESGRLRREEDAVREALALWEERERTRAEILASVDEAEGSIVRGEGRVITQESVRDLAEDVKQRGRARLLADQQAGEQKARR